MGRERGNAMKYNKEFESKERTTDYSGWLEQELKECREELIEYKKTNDEILGDNLSVYEKHEVLRKELKECREWMSSLIISSYMTDNIKDDFLTKGKQLLKGSE